MPPTDNRLPDAFVQEQAALSAGPVPIDAHSTAPLPLTTRQLPAQDAAAVNQPTPTTKPLCDVPQQPVTTRGLPEVLQKITRQLPSLQPGTTGNTTQRMPVVIKGEMKKPLPLPPRLPHARRRLIVSLVGVMMLFLVMGITLLTVTPLGQDIATNFNPLLAGNKLVRNMNTNPGSLVAQATATAIFHQQSDGYAPSSSGSGGQTSGNGSGSLGWPVGQCTYWANLRYHALTGYWVSWNGNADQWVAGARAAGWNVSQTPHVPSIMVLMPGVEGASGYGHVAVVESMTDSTTVHTSNMNWYSNGGGFNVISNEDFSTGRGVYFIWHR